MVTYPLHLLYDSACPVCRLEMHELAARDVHGRLRLVDIAAPGFDPTPWGATLEAMNARTHAVDAAGVTTIGVAALRLAYAAVGLGAWFEPTRWPLLAQRVLFVTGDTLSPGAEAFLAEAGCASLDKPFSRGDLVDRVATLLMR